MILGGLASLCAERLGDWIDRSTSSVASFLRDCCVLSPCTNGRPEMRTKRDVCEYCQAALDPDERRVTVYRHRGGKHFIFEQVPARVCLQCGERYFSAPVVRAMDR